MLRLGFDSSVGLLEREICRIRDLKFERDAVVCFEDEFRELSLSSGSLNLIEVDSDLDLLEVFADVLGEGQEAVVTSRSEGGPLTTVVVGRKTRRRSERVRSRSKCRPLLLPYTPCFQQDSPQ